MKNTFNKIGCYSMLAFTFIHVAWAESQGIGEAQAYFESVKTILETN